MLIKNFFDKIIGLVKNERHFFLSLFFFMKIKFFKLKEQKLFLADINCTCAVNKADFHLKAQHVSDSLEHLPAAVGETVQTVFGGCVPKTDGPVVSAGNDESSVWGESEKNVKRKQNTLRSILKQNTLNSVSCIRTENKNCFIFILLKQKCTLSEVIFI